MMKQVNKTRGLKVCVAIAFGISALGTSMAAHSSETTCVSLAPDSRYEILPGGEEVRDVQTNLVWKRCPEGVHWNGTACETKIVLFNWNQALAAAAQDPTWRIPSTLELGSLQSGRLISVNSGVMTYDGCIKPAINTNIFPQTELTLKNLTWSSTSFKRNYNQAHNLWMGTTTFWHTGNSTTAKLRLVRDYVPN